MRLLVPLLISRWRAYRSDVRGSAAVEFALWLAALSVPIFAATDIGFYGFQTLQVHTAAQMAAQSGWAACNGATTWPATANCNSSGGAALNTAIAAGEHSTSLGTRVTVASGWEKFMCMNSSGNLVDVSSQDGSIATKTTSGVTDVDTSGNDTVAKLPSPADCHTVVAGSTTEPGDYISVTVHYTYHPIFKGFSVVTLLGGNNAVISQTAQTRIE